MAVRKPPASLFQRWFLLPYNPSAGQPPSCGVGYPSLSLDVGESSKRGDFEGVGDFCFQTLGVSHEGYVKGFWDLMTQVDEEQRQEALVSTPKLKGVER